MAKRSRSAETAKCRSSGSNASSSKPSSALWKFQVDLRGAASASYKEADRIWFKVLPGRRFRCRRLYDREPCPDRACTHVVVRQVCPGIRQKHYLGHPSMTRRLDAVESEELCKYLWDLAEEAMSEADQRRSADLRHLIEAAARRARP